MISAHEMPEDNADLAHVQVEFSRLQPDTAGACPRSIDDLLEHLRAESPDHESVHAGQLRFLRTALVADHRYWIWSFQELDGTDCFVTVSQAPNGTVCTGYDENYYGLTPEQFMLGDYHQVF